MRRGSVCCVRRAACISSDAHCTSDTQFSRHLYLSSLYIVSKPVNWRQLRRKERLRRLARCPLVTFHFTPWAALRTTLHSSANQLTALGANAASGRGLRQNDEGRAEQGGQQANVRCQGQGTVIRDRGRVGSWMGSTLAATAAAATAAAVACSRWLQPPALLKLALASPLYPNRRSSTLTLCCWHAWTPPPGCAGWAAAAAAAHRRSAAALSKLFC